MAAGAEVMLFEELTREALRRLAPDALVVWPVGATEQHGPHLPVGTDAMHAEWVARAAAERASNGARAAVVADFVAGMTDRYAISEHRRLFDASPDLG